MPPRDTCTPISPLASRRVAALIRRTGPTTLMTVRIATHNSSANTLALTQRIGVAYTGSPAEVEVLSVVRSLSGPAEVPEAATEPLGVGTGSIGRRMPTSVVEAGTAAPDPC